MILRNEGEFENVVHIKSEPCHEEEIPEVVKRYQRLDRTAREQERRLDIFFRSSLSIPLSSSRLEAEQVLSYYIGESRKNDVNYYFDGMEGIDWRIPVIVPLARESTFLGNTVLHLFAGLQRAKDDNGSDRHFLHYHTAIKMFQVALVGRSENWLSILSCVVLFAQYDVNTQRGINLGIHLKAIRDLLAINYFRKTPDILKLRRRTLISCAMIYDLQHALISGSPLHIPLEIYKDVYNIAYKLYIGKRSNSIEFLWSETRLLWATFIHETMQTHPNMQELSATFAQLHSLLAERRSDYNEISEDSPLHTYCPFGTLLIFKSPALRLLHVNLHALSLVMTSWFPVFVDVCDPVVSRNIILRSQAALFPSKLRKKKTRESERFLPQVFPAIVQIMLAAAEVSEDELTGQLWIEEAMVSAKSQGYSLGYVLLTIVKSHTKAGLPWRKLGCRTFIETCRYLRKSGLA